PHLFMFLAGVVIQRNWNRVLPVVEGKAGWWMAAYLTERLAERALLGAPAAVFASATPATIAASALSFGLLAMTVISAAYTRRTASRILHGHDLSYGIYIYHMLVINALVQIGLTGSAALIPAVVAVVVAL